MHLVRRVLFRGALLCAFFTPLAAHAVPVDAPELAAPGALAVGVRKLQVTVGSVPDPAGGAAIERRINALLWYPASAAPTQAPTPQRTLQSEVKNHPWRGLPSASVTVSVPSMATPDAALIGGNKLPVVLLSHGLMNWVAHFNNLAEHLASRGYVVLGLEHGDEAFGNPLQAAFLLRPLDQGAAIRALQAWNETAGNPLHQRLDVERLALVGYSMGAYGALVSAGARVASDGVAYNYVPGGAMARHAEGPNTADATVQARIAAVVLMAPFGGQASIGAFKAKGLATVTAPTLVMVGDQDDISGYGDGVRKIWDGLVNAPRWLLTYENARHNIALHGAPEALRGDFRSWSNLEEPVWRRDRLLDINRHFVTAFLDLSLRGQKDAALYLNPAVTRANEGAWPEAFGAPATGRFAGAPAGPITHWAGFQRRWAVGLRLERVAP
jgi:predicted dienelactone hydrolase